MSSSRALFALTVLLATPDSTVVVPLKSTTGLTLVGVTAAAVSYRGRDAVRLSVVPRPGAQTALVNLALIDGSAFRSGTIEVMVASIIAPDADTSARGFVGLAFHSTPDATHFENIYLRPTNGRAPEQLRRNHAVQYESLPDYPWDRLRHDAPGQYESYTDLQPGVWTRMRIVVDGTRARLFVGDAQQPSLVVNDLKLGSTSGRIGLWVGPGTIGYFSRLSFTPAHP
jgi:hypothetical protein